ncbi:MAG: GNAT family N-acetyltransferase [Clostridiales bacterium]|nr:GNAT family N-acetyltransferase [Clostridiales bacterium]
MTIRPYQKKDFRYVQDICVATSKYADNDTPVTRATLTAVLCDYYLDNQSDYCFVAVDDNDIPVGYVLCSVDRDDYEEKMTELYLPLLHKLNSSEYFLYNAQLKVTSRYVRMGYLAHMHIHMLEQYESEELGTQLISTLENKLREMYVEGIYLVCGEKSSARALYDKLGYEDIDFLKGSVVYGKKFFTED